jgi:hypothetical protein
VALVEEVVYQDYLEHRGLQVYREPVEYQVKVVLSEFQVLVVTQEPREYQVKAVLQVYRVSVEEVVFQELAD